MNIQQLVAAIVTAVMLSFAQVSIAADAVVDPTAMTPPPTVNINEADAPTLASVLKGVGLRRAEAIVAYREANGKFYSAEELTAVRGIGKSTVEANADRIVVK